ncbi:protein of unknown function [Xenorhabdus poinarii G6]|uniref:Novel toxin 15 domain-containing protein n=1 Tax=Xenorhabdus poinarii G6 TaxID=1354304 RepID=A0A068R855_9GAMM|nr:polymorphic toxin type 15 domain-containing protein [Xenorhabdus poinarii]CDG22275.1 protein of unknown function [Xenorhabdus poinarii G6]
MNTAVVLVWSPGTHNVRISSLQNDYRKAISERYERRFGKAPNLSKLNADHPVDLIVGGSATQRLKMLNESINKSVGSALKSAGRKANTARLSASGSLFMGITVCFVEYLSWN